jgi:hypothetical protein
MLGKRFFATKKFPLPVSLADDADWQAQIDAVIRSTQLMLQGGGTLAIRVGRVADASDHVADNIITAMRDAVAHIGGWDNVRALFIKTSISASVPVYQAPPLDREVELKLREKLLSESVTVQTYGPVAEKARKAKLAEFEAKLANDPRAAKKREFAFLFEQGIEVGDELLSDSTEDAEVHADKKARSDAGDAADADADAADKASPEGKFDDDDDDDDEDDENSGVLQAIEQRKNAQQKKLLAEHEQKRKRRAVAPGDDDEDDGVAQESVAALQLKAKQLALEKAKGAPAKATVSQAPAKASAAAPILAPAKATAAVAATTSSTVSSKSTKKESKKRNTRGE